jgi:two-component system response regulator
VVFTTSQGEADIYVSYRLGANAYVVKPTDDERFRDVVRLAASFWLNSNVRPPHC